MRCRPAAVASLGRPLQIGYQGGVDAETLAVDRLSPEPIDQSPPHLSLKVAAELWAGL